jgi:Calcineurin-like phosphoesterase
MRQATKTERKSSAAYPRIEQSVELPRVESTHSLSARIDVEIANGSAICFSDCHYDPGAPASTAHRAVVKLAKSLKPDLLLCGGDALDAAALSRHPRIMWEDRPKPVDEIAVTQQRLREIQHAAPRARRVWTIGNHDQRLSSYLAQNAPQLEGIHGTCLGDFFPTWEMAWAAWINPGATFPTVCKHRWHGGAQAARSNVTKGGTHVITGHTHLAAVVAHTDWLGTRYGVDTGCVADVNSRLFAAYTEKGCTGWRSGAAVLQFADGEMLPPELIQVVKESPVPGEGRAFFRGALLAV